MPAGAAASLTALPGESRLWCSRANGRLSQGSPLIAPNVHGPHHPSGHRRIAHQRPIVGAPAGLFPLTLRDVAPTPRGAHAAPRRYHGRRRDRRGGRILLRAGTTGAPGSSERSQAGSPGRWQHQRTRPHRRAHAFGIAQPPEGRDA
jgi:hypothetical protein